MKRISAAVLCILFVAVMLGFTWFIWTWQRADVIQAWQVLGTWAVGVVGAVFVFFQNKILHRQNELLEKQNEYLANQKDLNKILIEREEAAQAEQKLEKVVGDIAMGIISGDAADKALEALIDEGNLIQHIRRAMLRFYRLENVKFEAHNPVNESIDRIRLKQAAAMLYIRPQKADS